MASAEVLTIRLASLEPRLHIAAKRERAGELKLLSESPTLWDTPEKAVAIMSELREVETLLQVWDDTSELLGLGNSLTEQDLAHLEADVVKLERLALFSETHDESSALVTIHAGTGGTDAQDWAEMLERMFIRFVEQGKTEQIEDRVVSIDRTGWKVELLEVSRGEEAGIKRAVLEVQGRYAYGLLKSEAGVHRLVRLSPFNAKSLRQTSFALIEVIPEVDQSTAVTIDEKDLRIDVYRSGGNGGQGVNTTDSAVRITHLPSGLVVAVQNERSQHQNKATAMKILQSRLVRLQELKNQEETAILRGEFKEGTWGNQIRSYVMQPYQMVKDHRTSQETADVQGTLDGNLRQFIEAYLAKTPDTE